MARTQGRTRLIITSSVLGLTLLVVGGIILFQQNHNAAKTSDTSTPAPSSNTTKPDISTADNTSAGTTPKTNSASVDPSTLASIDVAPLGVTVFYTKGIHGFNFEVKRTANQTQYAEFSSPELIGKICTDDSGSFASIIKNPTSTEDQTTITLTTKIGNDSYGLSLAGKNCTADQQLLAQYQTAFTNGFPSLKAL